MNWLGLDWAVESSERRFLDKIGADSKLCPRSCQVVFFNILQKFMYGRFYRQLTLRVSQAMLGKYIYSLVRRDVQ